MATHMWDDVTEGDVWIVEPGSMKDFHPSSSDTDSTIDTMETIDSADLGGECGGHRNQRS
jgi:hypothetical protein